MVDIRKEENRLALLNDPEKRVRLHVARHANKEHAEKLMKDYDKSVATVAKSRLKKLTTSPKKKSVIVRRVGFRG